MTHERLTLPEELLLLGWDDERGRNVYTSNLEMLLAGAAIVDLVLDGNLSISNRRLEVTGAPTGRPHLDLVRKQVRDSRKRRTTKVWVQRLGGRSHLKKAILKDLANQGIVAERHKRMLGLIPITRYPVTDTMRVESVRRRAAESLTRPAPVEDTRDAALGGLIHPAGGRLVRRLVSKDQRRAARQRAKALSKGDAVSADVARAIDDANAAMIAAVGAASAAAASSSGSS